MRRVLVIDDHEPSRNNLTRVLKESGYEITEATSSTRGLELTASALPEVVLMAVGLPDIDGIRAARKIMEANPLPIVLLTSHHDAATVERAKRAGVMGCLIKPLRESELVPAIELAAVRFQEFSALQEENKNLKKTLEARKIIERAKGILMKRDGLSEPEAFSRIQKKSMNMRKPMVEIAQAVILSQEIAKREK